MAGFDVIVVVHKPIKNELVIRDDIKKLWSKVVAQK